MATTTTRLELAKPATGDMGWGATWNANADLLDIVQALGALFVTPHESPSASLNISVSAGRFNKTDGSIVTYAGSASFAVTTAITNYLWLTDAGVLTLGTAWPTNTFHVPLATVVAGATTITSIADARVNLSSAGIVQPSGANQAAVAALTTVALTDSTGGAATATLAVATNTSALTNSTGGTVSTTLAAGITDAVANNAIASLAAQLALQLSLNTVLINATASLALQVNHAVADLAALRTFCNQIQGDLVTTKIIKGSA